MNLFKVIAVNASTDTYEITVDRNTITAEQIITSVTYPEVDTIISEPVVEVVIDDNGMFVPVEVTPELSQSGDEQLLPIVTNVERIPVSLEELSLLVPTVTETLRANYYTGRRALLVSLSKLNPNVRWGISEYNLDFPPLTRRQFRLILTLQGFNIDDIYTLINQIEDPLERQYTLIEWDDAVEFERGSQTLIKMGAMMGLSEEQIDALWGQALLL